MKKIITLLLMLGCFLNGNAQNTSNVILFNQEGNAFTAILNGMRMNEAPLTNLKITDLSGQVFQLKLIFDDPNLGEVDKKLYLEPGIEVSMRVMKNKKGAWVVRYQGDVSIASAPAPPSNQQVIPYSVPGGVGTNVTVTEQTTTITTTGSPPTGESINMGMSVDGMGMNVNVNVNEGSMGSGGNISTTTTTTTTTTGSGGWEEPTGVATVYSDCYAMDEYSFQDALTSVKSKSFSDSKMTVAKQIATNNCLSADQVLQMLRVFDFEDDKLEFAKFAWPRCTNPNNYYKVNDAFEFESSIEDLDEYIQRQR